MNKAMFSSNTDEWATPQAFFDALDEEFHFTLDPCATPQNAKCVRFFTKEINGLTQIGKTREYFAIRRTGGKSSGG